MARVRESDAERVIRGAVGDATRVRGRGQNTNNFGAALLCLPHFDRTRLSLPFRFDSFRKSCGGAVSVRREG